MLSGNLGVDLRISLCGVQDAVFRFGVRYIPMQLEGFTTQPRHGVVFEVKESILACGGFILDHQQFSNHLIRLSIEIRGDRLNDLVAKLEGVGVSLSQSSIDEARHLLRESPDSRIAGSLAIRFVSDEPDLMTQVPAIPG